MTAHTDRNRCASMEPFQGNGRQTEGASISSRIVHTFNGKEARLLRQCKFELEKLIRSFKADDNTLTRATSLAIQQIIRLHNIALQDRRGKVSTSALDMHARPLRLETQRILLDLHKKKARLTLRDSTWDDLSSKLLSPTSSLCQEEGADRNSNAEESFELLLKTLPENFLIKELLDAEMHLHRTKTHGRSGAGEGDTSDTPLSTTNTTVSKWESKRRLSDEDQPLQGYLESCSRMEPEGYNRKQKTLDGIHEKAKEDEAKNHVNQPEKGKYAEVHARTAKDHSMERQDSLCTRNVDIAQGANMFTSAKQALTSNLNAPTEKENYSHTISNGERQPTVGWNKANLYKRRMLSFGTNKATNSSTPSAFVPPYVKRALEACGQKTDSAIDPSAQQDDQPFTPKVMHLLLQHANDGMLPDAILKLDSQLVESICSDIMDRTGITWADIVGQEDAKRLVQEMVVWPMLNPNLFKGIRTPPKGLLLFGPPGTGKTLIGKAIASNIKATFFNISASSLTSKWIGEGEKMVKTLFTLAGYMQPAVIFIDEIDSILSARKSDGEHESSRRLKTEILVQIEGCDPSCSERRVLIVGATNRPEELDEAARRRMPKQLYIPLPCDEARQIMVQKGISQVKNEINDESLAKIVEKTKGYSGSDMRNFIQEACQGPVRDALSHAHQESDVANLCEKDLRAVVLRDFAMASRAQRATVSEEEIKRYKEYDSKHGTAYVAQSTDCYDDW